MIIIQKSHIVSMSVDNPNTNWNKSDKWIINIVTTADDSTPYRFYFDTEDKMNEFIETVIHDTSVKFVWEGMI